MSRCEILQGDCRELMAGMEPDSVDAIVTDPPYGLEFMGKEWDRLGGDVLEDPASVGGFQDGSGGNPYSRSRIRYGAGASAQAWHEAWAREAFRVLKPGGHLLAFSGSRTYHRLACAVEDAGFEIRDQIMWLYGSGFPKSLDVSKAMDRAVGAEREVMGERVTGAAMSRMPSGEALGTGGTAFGSGQNVVPITAPATDLARKWQGWGTALKPAHEPIVVARKPLIGTVAENVERFGTGAINIDGCRIPVDPADPVNTAIYHNQPNNIYGKFADKVAGNLSPMAPPPGGRWPANVVLDEEAGAMLDEQSGFGGFAPGAKRGSPSWYGLGAVLEGASYGDFGGASRFFYCPKAARSERETGTEGLERKPYSYNATTKRCTECGCTSVVGAPKDGGVGGYMACGHDPALIERIPYQVSDGKARNHHPTVKPVDLMRWLVRLVTPPGGLVLDPFAGSGTTGVACSIEGFDFVGLEMDPEYAAIARGRISAAPLSLFAMAASS